MKALFCYDGPLYKDEFGNYYDSILNDKMFERYFAVSSHLTLAIRIREIKSVLASSKMDRLSNPNISIVEIPNLSSLKGLFLKSKEAKTILKKAIIDADLVFIRLPSVIGNISVDICKKYHKKYLIEVVGCPWDSYWNYNLLGKLLAPIAKAKMKRRVLKSKFTLYVTSEFLQKRYPTKGKSISCSNVELDEVYYSTEEKRITHINNKQKDDIFVIGTAAGLDVKYKGQQYVIRALAFLKEKYGLEGIEYQLIGNGTGERLKELAKRLRVEKQLKIIGQVPHSEVFKWLDSIDIYAQPSRQEGLPRSVIEAMSRGIVCIGSDTAGIPELLEKEYIIKKRNKEIKMIAMTIRNIILDKKRSELSSKRNFEEAKKYRRDLLSQRRKRFFEDFVKEEDY